MTNFPIFSGQFTLRQRHQLPAQAGIYKEYLPKTSPRFSELQRLLKLTSQPLFPSVMYTCSEGKTIPRDAWDLFRGFVAGVYEERQPYIIVVCRQNMGSILGKSSLHRTKKRFYIETDPRLIPACYFFDARQTIFVFVELVNDNWADQVFKEVYPSLVDCKIAGVVLKNLVNSNLLMPALEKMIINGDNAAQSYLLNLCKNLQPLPADFSLNKHIIW